MRWQTVGTSGPPLLGVEVGARPAWESLGQRAGSQVPATPTGVLGKDPTMKRGQWPEPPGDLAKSAPRRRGARAGWLRWGCIRVRSAGLCGQEQCSLCPRGQPGRVGQRLVTHAWGWAERGPQVGGPSPEGLLSPPVARPGRPRTGDTPTDGLPESESRAGRFGRTLPGALEPACSRASRQPHVQSEADAAQPWARRPQPRLSI